MVKQEIVKCYTSQKFDAIVQFKGKKLTFGGLILDNRKTFGDYQISNFKTLFVYDPGYSP